MMDNSDLDLLNSYAGLGIPTPATQKMDKGDILDKIKPDLIIEVMRHKLMGEDLIKGAWRKIPSMKDRCVSEVCAWDMANLMLGVSSQNVALSKLNDREIRERTMEIVKTAQYMLLKNWKIYKIKGIDQLNFVHQLIISNTFITLKQPEGEGIRKLIKGTIQESRSVVDNQQSKKKGGFLEGLIRK